MKMPLSLGSTWWEVSAIRFDSVTSKGKGTSKQKLKTPISFHQIVRLLFKPDSFVAQIPYCIMWKTANPMPQSHKSPLWECVFNGKNYPLLVSHREWFIVSVLYGFMKWACLKKGVLPQNSMYSS